MSRSSPDSPRHWLGHSELILSWWGWCEVDLYLSFAAAAGDNPGPSSEPGFVFESYAAFTAIYVVAGFMALRGVRGVRTIATGLMVLNVPPMIVAVFLAVGFSFVSMGSPPTGAFFAFLIIVLLWIVLVACIVVSVTVPVNCRPARQYFASRAGALPPAPAGSSPARPARFLRCWRGLVVLVAVLGLSWSGLRSSGR